MPNSTGPFGNEARTRFPASHKWPASICGSPASPQIQNALRACGGSEFFPPAARKRVCAGKTFAGFSCTIPISPPQRPIFACGKNGKAPKKKDTPNGVSFFFGAGNEARTRYLHLGKVALYQMSYARGTRCILTEESHLVKHFP